MVRMGHFCWYMFGAIQNPTIFGTFLTIPLCDIFLFKMFDFKAYKALNIVKFIRENMSFTLLILLSSMTL